MKTSAKTKLVESLLVIAGFGAWMAIGIAYEDRVEESFDFSYLVGTLIFFVIAFFIPERPRGSFISRSQVIGVAALLLWIGLNQLFKFGEPSLRDQFESTAGSLSFGISSIVAPFIFYWGATFLIRGFYADPAYQTNEEAEQAGTGQPATRPVFESEGADKPQPESEGRSR